MSRGIFMYETAEQLQPKFDQYERHVDDTETWLAETLNGSMRTRFEFDFDGQELYAQDGGALGGVFDDAIKSAQVIAKENPALLFELRRRVIERGEYDDMLAMARGELYDENGEEVNVMVVTSDFPPELMSASEDVGGYNVDRQQTMLRIISRQVDGTISVTTQSLDRSNRRALESVHNKLGFTAEDGELLGQRVALRMPEEWHSQLVDNLTNTYDESLEEQYGGKWHAGIKQEKILPIDTYEFACAQTDLIEWFAGEKLKDSQAAEKLRYQVAATARKRWENYCSATNNTQEVLIAPVNSIVGHAQRQTDLLFEIALATIEAQNAGLTFSGCGASVSAPGMGGAKGELSQLGYGNKSDEDDYGPLTFECTEGHKNTRPRGKLISKCGTKDCKGSVGC
ncbi:MAG: hypothetical protein U0524_04045 [Candidatus Saccharimonadales bacterium]